jgi:hypothetical protein
METTNIGRTRRKYWRAPAACCARQRRYHVQFERAEAQQECVIRIGDLVAAQSGLDETAGNEKRATGKAHRTSL